mmetsp:Transcript_9179/g.10646  ORF Transcript_9179/g.10646 Transcript_9179/m.10646 type:complete len:566 (-) Transcript_9179:62-1759(-)
MRILQTLIILQQYLLVSSWSSTLLNSIHRHSTPTSTHHNGRTHTNSNIHVHRMLLTESEERVNTICDDLNNALLKCQPEFIKTCKVKVAPSPNNHRLGLIATEKIKKGDVALSMPYDDQVILTPELATKEVWKGILPEGYDGWTGDNGLLALLVLNELAKTATDTGAGIQLPKRKIEVTSLMKAWVASLPTPEEMTILHPIMWDEENQDILQSSSTKKVYKILDDIDEDANWLQERVWSKNRDMFPETVSLNDVDYPCFTPEGFAWAMTIVTSRTVFVDGTSRIIPLMDLANHDDLGVEEVSGGFMGTFGTTKGVVLRTGKIREYKANEEVFVSYGPKSAAEYCLEHGFVPKKMRDMTTSVAELTFELDPKDRFYDDKLDILEFETYESAPMEPIQSFDVVSEGGRDEGCDPAMIQFLRLMKLDTKDAFLLESVFRKDVWGFMSLPVSDVNERGVLDTIVASCSKALEGMDTLKDDEFNSSDYDESDPTSLCRIIRESERKALSRTLKFVTNEKEAVDLKEYYQQRRLRDLNLDSDWKPDESSPYSDDGDELGFGQQRAPGSLDW